jgi:hypothetical protein
MVFLFIWESPGAKGRGSSAQGKKRPPKASRPLLLVCPSDLEQSTVTSGTNQQASKH